jgi:MscS family membrane protein
MDLSDYLFLGNGLERWLPALAFVVGGFALGKALSWLSSKVLRRISARTKTRLDDVLLAVTEKPLAIIVMVGGLALGLDRLEMTAEAAAWTDKSFFVLAAAVAAWTLVRVIDAVMDEILVPYAARSKSDLDDQLLPILRKTLKLLVWILAVLGALKHIGYDVGALLAGLGLGGVAVALAAKDTLSNFFGSVAILVDHPFQLNDRIKVAGLDGNVVDIGIRTSRLKTLDNRIVTVPNAVFAANPIENVSSEPHTKVTQTVELARSNGPDKLAEAVAAFKAAAAAVEGTDGEAAAGITAIADWSFRATFVFYVKKGANYLETVNAVNLEALRRLEAAGVELAVPARRMVE